MNYLYNVATNKEVLLTIRVTESVRDDFKKAAELRGATMSGLMHQFIVMTIRQEKAEAPHEFRVAPKLAPVVATIGGATADKEAIRRQVIGDEEISEIESRIGKRKKVPVLKQKAS